MVNSLFRRFMMATVVAALGILVLTVGVASAMQLSNSPASKGYKFTTLNDNADPTFNQLLGINNSGDTSGFYVDANGNNFGFVEWKGVFTSYKDPHTGSGTVNQLLGINDKGIAVGFYVDGNGDSHAYKVNQASSKFTAIVPPNGTDAVATGINDNGDIVGFLTGSNGDTVGFLLKGKTFTEFDFPGSTVTNPFGVNKSDQIVGSYVDGNGNMHGFLLTSPLNNAQWKSIDDPNGIGTTTINGLNDKGQLVGFYVDSNGNTDGFLAKKK
jgi:hypothetical protein